MFGLFEKKIPVELDRQLATIGEFVTSVLGPPITDGSLQFKGVEDIELTAELRLALKDALTELTEEYSKSEKRGEFMSNVEFRIKESENSPSYLLDLATFMLLSALAKTDLTVRIYKQEYSGNKQMQEYTSNLMKVAAPGLAYAIGDDLPSTVRRVFPDFSHYFEAVRAETVLVPRMA